MSTTNTRDVYLTGFGAYMPGEPISNDEMEDYLGLVGGKPSRLRKRILKSNGITSRHYALDKDGRTTELNEELAAKAAKAALDDRGIAIDDVEMLAFGTTQGDLPFPGFASMVHGRLGGSPLEVLSAAGVCASSMAAFNGAYRAIRSGHRKTALAGGSECVGRLLTADRFEKETTPENGRNEKGSFRDFDADFLRWMLSDGAGAVVLEDKPKSEGLSLRVDWTELVSHANELPVCMYVGLANKDEPTAGSSWLDYPTVAMAEHEGILKLRQDTRILPNIVRLGVEEWLRLVRQERIRPEEVDHVLCHYSSEFFRGEIMKALADTDLSPGEEKFWTNLHTKGNTGAASIWIMLEEAMHTGRIKKGDTIILMVPESGRFSVAFTRLTCVGPEDTERAASEGVADVGGDVATTTQLRASQRWTPTPLAKRRTIERTEATIEEAIAASPLGADFAHLSDEDSDEILQFLTLELALVWADFERMLRTTPILQRLESGTITVEDYKRLLINLRQQVMEGARWIARAASNVSIELFEFRSMFIGHAREEHKDYQMIERDYCAVGGSLEEIYKQPKNVGSEALSAFMFHHAGLPDPIDMLGSMFVIEGLGTKKAAEWAEQLKEHLDLEDKQVTFLKYHGKNDDNHFEKLRDTIRSGIIDHKMADRIVKTAKVTARLYALQLEEIDNV
jgi:3-oxoacyl-[acyl-carrier-protein] synthase-3